MPKKDVKDVPPVVDSAWLCLMNADECNSHPGAANRTTGYTKISSETKTKGIRNKRRAVALGRHDVTRGGRLLSVLAGCYVIADKGW